MKCKIKNILHHTILFMYVCIISLGFLFCNLIIYNKAVIILKLELKPKISLECINVQKLKEHRYWKLKKIFVFFSARQAAHDEENDSRVSRTESTESNLRVVDLLILAQNLWCQACDVPLSLKNCIHEKRSVFSSTLWVSCYKCQSVTKFDTLNREDRAKPLQHKNLANAKKLSFLSKPSGQNNLKTDCIEDIKRKRKSLDKLNGVTEAKTAKVFKGPQINDITSSCGDPIKGD